MTKSGSSLIVSKTITVHNNSFLTFRAPCSCQGILSITINKVVYNLIDSAGNTLEGTQSFIENALVSVIIDTTNKKAYILNSASVLDLDSLLELTPDSIVTTDSDGSLSTSTASIVRRKLGLGESTGALSTEYGGTGVGSMVGDDYNVNRPRGIILQDREPNSVSNGCIVGVYE